VSVLAGPLPSPEDGARWYLQGQRALAQGEWLAACAAFDTAVGQLRASAEWALLWRCLLGRAAVAWRVGDDAAAVQHALAARDVAARLHDGWPTVWSCWLLGHIHAARSAPDPAADCFIAAAQALRPLDDRLIEGLATAAAALCEDRSRQDLRSLAEQLFGLLRLSFERARCQDVPLDALYGLPSPPLLWAVGQRPSGDGPWALISRLQRFFVVPADSSLAKQVVQQRVATPPTSEVQRVLGDYEDPGDGEPPDLRACCLGRFRVFVGDTPLVLSSGARSKPKTLLKLLLAAYPQPVPRDRILEVLWPTRGRDNEDEMELGRSRSGSDANRSWKQEQEEKLALQRLHTVVSDLRSALNAARPDAGKLIVARQDAYGLDEQVRVWVDTVAFSQEQRMGQHYEQLGRIAEAQAAYERAVDLYGGSFLDEDRFVDWPTGQRARLEHAYLDMLTTLSQWAFAEQNYVACIRWGQALVECDPGREDIHCQLMRCYSRQGQRSQALRQYLQCVRALRESHEALPSAETDDLYRALQQGKEI